MEKEILRSKLHGYIDTAEEDKLQAIYTLLEDDIEPYNFTKEEIAIFYERREKHIKGASKSYTTEESITQIRKSLYNAV